MTRHHALRRRIVCSLPIACALLPHTASALDWGIQPRLDAGGMFYSLDIKGNVGQLTGVPQVSQAPQLEAIEAVMPLVSGGVTVFADRFFLDLSAQGAFAGESDFIDRSGSVNANTLFPGLGFPPGGEGGPRKTTGSTDLDRQEYAVSAGMQVTDSIAFFGGYKFGRTNFDNIKITDTANNVPIPDDQGAIVLFYNFDDRYTFDNRFDQEGFFFGGTMGTEVGGAGFLSFKVAIAFLTGEMSITGSDVFSQSFVNAATGGLLSSSSNTFLIDNTIKGDTTGVNIGLSWNGAIPQVKGLSYTLSVDGYRYEFDGTFNEDSSVVPSFAETVARFTAGVAYTF